MSWNTWSAWDTAGQIGGSFGEALKAGAESPVTFSVLTDNGVTQTVHVTGLDPADCA